ncbi:hypothetical protein ACMD2_25781 [Ananas comosus]|uniref:Uncharacterized protein n=1 Tax=Ananas comosus TaxID=4615 RepID=A0A199VZU4_ANACO|nr:hypothetical protein ACMD2_25781 [Ananas comosus]
MASSSSGGRRRGKWVPPTTTAAAAAPTPRMLLRLPRRSRVAAAAAAPRRSGSNLGALFDMERRARARARARAAAGEGEREVAQREVDRQRARVAASLKSAVETLVSGRKKIEGRSGDGAVGLVLEEEIRELEEQIAELQAGKEEGSTGTMRGRCRELQRSRGRNFDRQASALRRRLEKMADPPDHRPSSTIKEIREIIIPPQINRNVDPDRLCSSDVEMLKRKMEGLSKGMLERVAEYGCLLSNANPNPNPNVNPNSNSKSGGNSKRSASRWSNGYQQQQQQVMVEECTAVGLGGCCDCREVVTRITEQVRAESEQWTEMQAMLEQVRLEMQDLQSSRDLWERRAVASEISVRSLHAQMLEWKHRAHVSERRVDEMQKQVSELQKKLLHSLRFDLFGPSFSSQERPETHRATPPRIKSQQKKKSTDSNKEKEKHVLVCRAKNSPNDVLKRPPLQDVGNISRLHQR